MKRPWDEEMRMAPILVGEANENDELDRLWRERQAERDESRESRGLFGEMLRHARWILFVEDDDLGESLEIVFYAIDLRTAEIVLSRGLLIGGFDDDDDLRLHLALAIAEEVPVLAEDERLQARLDAHVRGLLTTGFRSTLEGSPKHLRFTPRGETVDVSSADVEWLTAAGRQPTLSEARIAIATLREELAAHEAASRTLASLRLAIHELEHALGGDVAEQLLQETLTRHPVLFGPEYVRVIPQHRLGAEYVMDFALERSSGLYDLVEIEKSTHRLFKKTDGAPTAALIHAEQQVLDWLAWTESHGAYARERLPGLQRPIGWVVIGRGDASDESTRRRLNQRNAVLAPALHVLTWDDLLERGRHLLNLLSGTEPTLE